MTTKNRVTLGNRLTALILAALLAFAALSSCSNGYMTYPFSDLRPYDANELPSPAAGNFRPEDIHTFWFNSDTEFPGSEDEAEAVMEAGKNPGLGVRALHEEGITGAGVAVAIIGGALAQPFHSEYAGQIVEYKCFGVDEESDSTEGPVVASLLAGEQCGVAPDAEVYYAAVPESEEGVTEANADRYTEALRWVIETNSALEPSEKIRVVAIAESPSRYNFPNVDYDRAVIEATEAGILVLDERVNNYGIGLTSGFVASGFYDWDDPENVEKFNCGSPERPSIASDTRLLFAPAAYRTTAEHYSGGEESWQYNGFVGDDAAIAYVAGLLALAWQLAPELSAQEAVDLMYETARSLATSKIVNPPAFIQAVEEWES